MVGLAETFPLFEEDFVFEGKSEASTIGLAIDLSFKRLLLPIGAEPGPQYAPWDYRLDGVYHEIKSSEGKWITLSDAEYRFGVNHVKTGSDVIYDIIKQNGRESYDFYGHNSFKQIYEAGKIYRSQYPAWERIPSGWQQTLGWYWSFSTAVNNLL